MTNAQAWIIFAGLVTAEVMGIVWAIWNRAANVKQSENLNKVSDDALRAQTKAMEDLTAQQKRRNDHDDAWVKAYREARP